MAWVDKQPLETELKFLCLIWQLVYIPCDKKWGTGEEPVVSGLTQKNEVAAGWWSCFPMFSPETQGLEQGLPQVQENDSGMINKQIHKTRAANSCDAGTWQSRKATAKRRHGAGERSPVPKGLMNLLSLTTAWSNNHMWVSLVWLGLQLCSF